MKKIKELKNNKSLLAALVVSIITFMVLVAGITYAFFSANNTATGTTTLDATTEAIGNVIVENPTQNLYLKVSAYDMQEIKKNTSYYATSTNGTGSSVYASEKENHVLANYTISAGEEDTVYNCTFKLNVTKPTDIRSGDMNLEINLLNGAKINNASTLTTDLYSAETSYTVSFNHTGNGTGNLITGDIRLNNTTSVQDHLEGKTISSSISISDLSCEIAEPVASICTYDTSSTIAEGDYGAKYNCKVDPNKPEYTFYLLDNNTDGTSDLIMNANINAAGEAVIPGVTADTGKVAWYADEDNNINGPVTAMTYLYNATKSWTNVDPLNYEYYDREAQGITATDIGYQSFVSTNGIAVITKGDINSTTVTIGTSTEPMRARLSTYIVENLDESELKHSYFDWLMVNLDVYDGYWMLSSMPYEANKAWMIATQLDFMPDYTTNGLDFGVRPVITVTL